MDTMSAFIRGEASRNNTPMVFDWHKAAQLIRERKPTVARAGLRSDWEWTGGDIYRDGKPVPQDDTYTYLCSTWAVPELELDGEVVECFVKRESGVEWDANTYWPESAIALLA